MVMQKIRAAVFGVGNSFKSLVYGLTTDIAPWHRIVGGFDKSSIEIVGAYDIDSAKVGKTVKDVLSFGPEISVERSIVYPDEVSRELRDKLSISPIDEGSLQKSLCEKAPDVVINLINSGQQRATRAIALATARCGASLVNATPERLVTDSNIVEAFKAAKAVIAGDDLQSQIGGTWLHKVLLRSFKMWGSQVVKSYQLDVGGSLETLNTLDERIRQEKKSVKGASISTEDKEAEVVAGTTDYIPFLEDWRVSHFYMEVLGPFGETFTIDAEYKTRDGSNAFNVLIDVVRAVKHEQLQGSTGTVMEINAYGFKSPGRDVDLFEALNAFETKYCSA